MEVCYQIGPQNERGNCLIDVVEKLMEEPIFDELRTKQALATRRAVVNEAVPRLLYALATSKHTAGARASHFASLQRRFLRFPLSASRRYVRSVEGLVTTFGGPITA